MTTTKTTIPQGELLGWRVEGPDQAALRAAVDLAINYRGDVTVCRASDGMVIEGYVFDVRNDRATGQLSIRMIPKAGDDRIVIALNDLAWLQFTGKDTASGKSFETWIKKYAQAKLAGESANIESESLDEM